jgi:hypothetical protein
MFQALCQFHRGIVPDAQALGEMSHGRGGVIAGPDHQQRLVLLRSHPLPGGGGFAELKEAAQRIAKVGQPDEVGVAKFLRTGIHGLPESAGLLATHAWIGEREIPPVVERQPTRTLAFGIEIRSELVDLRIPEVGGDAEDEFGGGLELARIAF